MQTQSNNGNGQPLNGKKKKKNIRNFVPQLEVSIETQHREAKGRIWLKFYLAENTASSYDKSRDLWEVANVPLSISQAGIEGALIIFLVYHRYVAYI